MSFLAKERLNEAHGSCIPRVAAVGLIVGRARYPAKKKKKPKAAAPIPVTLFAHGPDSPGNIDPSPAGSGAFMTMDTTEPTESTREAVHHLRRRRGWERNPELELRRQLTDAGLGRSFPRNGHRSYEVHFLRDGSAGR